MNIRVRYAPSPTGKQHIGGIRNALFNYLYARAAGGKFILRVEDTDRERFQPESLQDIYDTFQWLGFHWDEGPDLPGKYGPYVQSERSELYKKYAKKLVNHGKAYYCYCTPERLEELKRYQQDKNFSPGYDRHCRDMSEKQAKEFIDRGINPVIRFKIPLDGKTSFKDKLLGEVTRANLDISPDPILLKSDGFPTYHLANIIDDHFMDISLIIRSQEWLPSVPLHILLYEALGWKPPEFCHVPLVLGKDGQKLSKRHGSTSISEFKKLGYLPEAIINFTVLLGWAYDDRSEFFTLNQLEKKFTLEKLKKSPAVFDYKKLQWFNGMYIRQKTNEELIELISPYLKEAGLVSQELNGEEKEKLYKVIPLIKQRLKLLSDAPGLVRFMFDRIDSVDINELIPKGLDSQKTVEILLENMKIVDELEKYSEQENEERFIQAADSLGVKLGELMMPLRVAISGTKISPPLIGSVLLLGLEETKNRINKAIKKLQES